MAEFKKSPGSKKHSIRNLRRVPGNNNVYVLNKEQYNKFLKKANMVEFNNDKGTVKTYFLVLGKKGDDLLIFKHARGHKPSYMLHRKVGSENIERITGLPMSSFVDFKP